MTINFAAVRPGVVHAVTAAAQAFPLSTDLRLAVAADDVLVDNRGDFDAFILFGDENGTVDKATGVRIIAGTIGVYGKGSATHIIVIGDGATQLVTHLGRGG